MRYFIRCRYNGTRYHGWQSQPDGVRTVQGDIEAALQMLLRTDISITGCGRTDTGVHASDYVFHADMVIDDSDHLLYKLNRIVDNDIVFTAITSVFEDAHARFDAISRSYRYHLIYNRDPFRQETAYYYAQGHHLTVEALNQVADLILGYQDFFPFCKTGSDAHTMRCHIAKCQWVKDEGGFTFHITADRFLRGMIRLIVGVSIFVAEDKISLSHVKEALDHQSRIDKAWSVPAQGLFLEHIIYPY